MTFTPSFLLFIISASWNFFKFIEEGRGVDPHRLIGKVIDEDVWNPLDAKLKYKRGQVIDAKVADWLIDAGIGDILLKGHTIATTMHNDQVSEWYYQKLQEFVNHYPLDEGTEGAPPVQAGPAPAPRRQPPTAASRGSS